MKRKRTQINSVLSSLSTPENRVGDDVDLPLKASDLCSVPPYVNHDALDLHSKREMGQETSRELSYAGSKRQRNRMTHEGFRQISLPISRPRTTSCPRVYSRAHLFVRVEKVNLVSNFKGGLRGTQRRDSERVGREQDPSETYTPFVKSSCTYRGHDEEAIQKVLADFPAGQTDRKTSNTSDG